MEENFKPDDRWFQFSLRTLLVLVAVLCIALASYRGSRWKRQREVMLNKYACKHVGYFPDNSQSPMAVRIFGGRAVEFIVCEDRWQATVEELFPEAAVNPSDEELDAILQERLNRQRNE